MEKLTQAATKTGEPNSFERGHAGELHPNARLMQCPMRSQAGFIVSDDENSLRAGERGPTLSEDHYLLEKTQHFDHERIPERVVHARGFGAHGYFELTDSLADVSKAEILNGVGSRTPVFVRFSTVAGSQGSSDLARDVRGFAVKFYTTEGNWDLVGNNIPVFFIQDAIKFTDLIHAAKPEPDRGFPQAQTAHDTFWDFASLMPESTHMLMWIMSDRAIPRSFRMMEGFGVHTYRLVDEAGKSTYVKFHWKPKQGLQSVIWDEALKISGADPDFHRRDLWNAIERGDYPEWELGVQLFDESFAERFAFDVLDATKVIPEEELPVRIIGRMVLDKNVSNFFAETEQAAFCVRNVVPGIDFTNDPLLQGRILSYVDTQLSRLGGPNYEQLPINAPRVKVENMQRDGHMQMSRQTGRVNYSPSSLVADVPRTDPKCGLRTYPEQVAGDKLRMRAGSFSDHYSQARQFFKSQTVTEQNHIIAAFVFELSKVETEAVRLRLVSQLAAVDPEIATRVSKGLGITSVPAPFPTDTPARTDLPASPALSILSRAGRMIKGRKIGCLVADGSDAAAVEELRASAKAAGAEFAVIAPRVGGAIAQNGITIHADFQLNGGPSVLFDSVYLALSPGGDTMLTQEAAAVAFVHDAFAHLKVIGATGAAQGLLTRAGVVADEGVLVDTTAAAYIEKVAAGRVWAREPQVRTIY